MFSKGSFVKWTDTMVGHSVIGQVIKDDGFRIEFETEFGTYNVQADDGTFEPASKPKNWTGSKVKTTFVLPAGEKPEQPKKPAKAKTGGKTKIELIVDMLREDPTLLTNRKVAIAMIVEAGISTPAGASTFYNTAKRMV